jgi:hypothetical protein
MPGASYNSPVTLIGDVIDSKSHPDRARLQRDLRDAHAVANSCVEAIQAPYFTVGDEFQAVYANIADAALVTMLLRLQLLGREHAADTRYGLGIGEFTVFEADSPAIEQDGPGWWAAREAIERVKRQGSRSSSASPHTWIRRWEGDDPAVSIANAFFLTRDALIDRMSARQYRLIVDLILGNTAAGAAANERITPPAASQTLNTGGAYALLDAHRVLAEAMA